MASSLPYTLSIQDAALFKSLQDHAILQEAAKPGQGPLAGLFKEMKRSEQKMAMEPYADLLEAQLMVNLWDRKSEILEELKKSKSTQLFSAKLFSWNSVNYYESILDRDRRVSAMDDAEWAEEQRKRYEMENRIRRNNWETMFRVEKTIFIDDEYSPEQVREQTYDSMFPVKVDRIFRQTDLAKRLSLALGPNFYPYISWAAVEGARESGDEDGCGGFQVYKKTLCVRYYPFGVPKKQLEELLKVHREQTARKAEGKIRALAIDEVPRGHNALLLDDDADMPPLVPATRVASLADDDDELGERRAERCFCGCGAEF